MGNAGPTSGLPHSHLHITANEPSWSSAMTPPSFLSTPSLAPQASQGKSPLLFSQGLNSPTSRGVFWAGKSFLWTVCTLLLRSTQFTAFLLPLPDLSFLPLESLSFSKPCSETTSFMMLYWITPASAFPEADFYHFSADTWGVTGFSVTAVFKPFETKTVSYNCIFCRSWYMVWPWQRVTEWMNEGISEYSRDPLGMV